MSSEQAAVHVILSHRLDSSLLPRAAAAAAAEQAEAGAEEEAAASAEPAAALVTPPQQDAAVAVARDAACKAWHRAAHAPQGHGQQPHDQQPYGQQPYDQQWPAAQPGGCGQPWAAPAAPSPWGPYSGEDATSSY